MAPRRSFPKTTGPMDQWLESQGYYRKHTARDGSCLFRAVSEQVFYTQAVHQDVRRQCVEFIRRNKSRFEKLLEEPIEEYVKRMMSFREWGGMLEIKAMALLYKYDMHVFEEIGKLPNVVTNHGFPRKILLCLSPENHYDSVYPKQYIVKAAFCQSIAYEVLYKNVFKLSDVNYAVNKMLHDKTSRLQKERLLNEDLLSCGRFGFSMEISVEANRDYRDDDEMANNVKELLAQGATPFPYKVAKALDPNIYRNIEFDIWNDYRREMKYGWYRNNGEFQVGVKCLVKLNPERNFHAHIQEMSPDKGPVIVFVEELGEKCTVPYDNLEPLPNSEKPQWPLPYKHCRHLSNIQPKSALLTLTEFGGKWKKPKIPKSRKVKENPVHTPLSPRLQYNSKMNVAPSKYQTQHNRFLREQISNQEIQVPYQNYTQENFNNMQNYNNVGMDMSSMSGSLMMEQPSSSTSPTMSQPMMMSLNSPPATSSSRVQSNVTQSSEISTTTTDRCISPVQQQPDSTTDIPSSQHSVPESQLPVDQSLCNHSAPLSPSQFISFAAYSNQASMGNNSSIPSTVPRPENSVANTGMMNSSNTYNETCSSNTSHVVGNPGVNVSYTTAGGSDQPQRDVSANILMQPVNFMAQKSVHLTGSDLPLSDIPTLRFYYNLGHDYFQLSCMYWPTSIQQMRASLAQPSANPAYTESQNIGNTTVVPSSIGTVQEHHSESTTLPEDLYQFGQEANQNYLITNDHNSHLASDENKIVCYHNNTSSNGETEVLWQPKQSDADISRTPQKTVTAGITTRMNRSSPEGRDDRIQGGRPNQNVGRAVEQYELQPMIQQPQDFESTCNHSSSAQNHSSNMLTTNYSIPPPAIPYTFTTLPPTVYNHTMVPLYIPVDGDQGMVPIQYYPQYTISPSVQMVSQESVDVATAISEVPTAAPQHITGSVCPMPQPSNVESSCYQPCAVYSSPPPPPPPPPTQILYQQPSSVPSGIYSTGTSPVAMQRWMQPTSGTHHMAPTQCLYQAPPPAIASAAVGFNGPSV